MLTTSRQSPPFCGEHSHQHARSNAPLHTHEACAAHVATLPPVRVPLPCIVSHTSTACALLVTVYRSARKVTGVAHKVLSARPFPEVAAALKLLSHVTHMPTAAPSSDHQPRLQWHDTRTTCERLACAMHGGDGML